MNRVRNLGVEASHPKDCQYGATSSELLLPSVQDKLMQKILSFIALFPNTIFSKKPASLSLTQDVRVVPL